MEIRDLIERLRDPQVWPGAPADVGFLQTHISLLFFAGDRVYKVKKRLRLPFLDYSTLERRKHFCEEEVRLNRRLAPRTYLGVVPIVRRRDGSLRAGARAEGETYPAEGEIDPAEGEITRAEGDVIDWAVEMERLPADAMLEALLARGAIDNERMDALAALLADFHAQAATGRGVDEHGSPDAVRRNVRENFSETKPFVGATIPAPLHRFLEARSRERLAKLEHLLARRVRQGRIRDGHGDLHASNVCFAEQGIVIYDCIEFSARLRCGDVACDLAFLAMDLDLEGFPAFARFLVRRYAELAGDPGLEELIGLYKGYRAMVRAKVAALASAEPELAGDARAAERAKALRYVLLAAAYELDPALILMCGLPASGKTWAARRVAPFLDPAVLSSDVRRKRLAGIPPNVRHTGAYEEGLYAPDMKERTYRSLLDGALEAVRAGRTAVVDATFSTRAWRAPFLAAAAEHGIPLLLVHVTAPEDVIRERMERRAADPHEASDATFRVYLAAKELFEPPDEVGAERTLVFDSAAGTDAELAAAVAERRIAARGRP